MSISLKENFVIKFGDNNQKIHFYFSPGRVNLIGDHTDYNGGYVFPCSLDFGTYAAARKRDDKLFRVYSYNFDNIGIIEFNLDELIYKKEDDWSNYPKGVIKKFVDFGMNINTGMDIYFYGNMPNGASLSSSASIETLMAEILKCEFNLLISDLDLIKLCQKAENEFIGVKSGILDQFAIYMGKKDNAIFLDCNTLNYEYVPLNLKDEVIVISNTNKKRGLVDSKYNERRMSCESALKKLNENGVNIKNLCDLNVEKFNEVKKFIDDEEELKRAKHAVYENERTKLAVKYLKENNINKFGELMNESHISLRDDYEVSCFELDTLVKLALEEKGTIGSRMTGGGFGGCTVSLVSKECVDDFINNVSKKYTEETGLKADFYVVNVGDGTKKLEE